MKTYRPMARAMALLAAGSVSLMGLGAAAPAQAQEADYLETLKACRAIADDGERLLCYDNSVRAVVAASDAGDVRIVDRDDVRRTRRQLFGFTVPDLDILEGDEQDKEASELLKTTISSARALSRKAWRFTTVEGAVWEIANAPMRLAAIKAGDSVEFKKASLGYFFIRINGQTGVKGKRLE